jgi:hypothetical protein
MMEIRLRFDENTHETVDAVEVSPGHFRLEATPLFAGKPLYLGDVIQATPLPDGTHRFINVVGRAPMRHHSWVVPRSFAEWTDREAFARAVEAAGGRVESVMGGILYVHVPENSSFDATAELDRYLSSD